MKIIFILILSLLLSACAGQSAPDWQYQAKAAVERYTQHYLAGDVKLAATSFARARAAVAATGDVAAVGHIELVRCGLRIAALDFAPCTGYSKLAALRTTPADSAYARFISGDWQGMETKLLPLQYAGLVGAASRPQADINRSIAAIDDPVSRLIASGIMVKRGQFDAATLQAAVDTASMQGWRRPLLTYLGLQEKQGGDAATLAAIQARIRLVEQSIQPAAKPATVTAE
ncbi:hypothetical protein TPL01_32240 [Sulfuriferula plumbiphila]|uniref:Lipoprotein n=1 Tax=Sulfuriferula plumbiphila TaxID=171865 RepID=A0A512LC85_9PROT|nr:hypothetical protein [Sulfuriferula plumbiphila]BBP04070.1 hypothetical protein SFPGR_14920 [Sulfuriferula plumbiphila]GEP32086.1 hypothetical protein TPL01_32240 [Sulfuriferula plumbiphila]